VNLVGNAIKFTDEGEVVLEVERESRCEDGVELHFTVRDTGIGIPEERQSAIFDAFEQADNSRTRRYGGTGLGLAISSRLASAMGGKIWLESEPGRGSTFHFTARLDVAPPDPAKPRDVQTTSIPQTPILVVDDNATNRKILDEMLRNWGMSPTVVASVPEAVRQLQEAHQQGQPYPLVITDASMPEMDGFDLVEQIKQDEQLRSTVVMMLSSGDRSEDVSRCQQLGVAAYLLKPVKQSELFNVIASALDTRTAGVESRHQAPTDDSKPLPSLRILLAEDSLFNQKLALGLLGKRGHSVVVANHGREAVDAWQSQDFDLILMDVQMPEMDGLEATIAIRDKESHSGQRIPIIAMTAHAMKGDREKCLEAGMDGYVAKPIHAAELFAAIESVLGSQQSHRP
jgi:CheY-like chemotaxis protein